MCMLHIEYHCREKGEVEGVVNMSESGVCGVVHLTDPKVLVKTGLKYKLPVYHSGCVACHLLLPSPEYIISPPSNSTE